MKRRFSLEPVLAFRSLRLDLARSELAAAQRLLAEQMDKVVALTAEEEQVMSAQTETLAANPVQLSELRANHQQLLATRLSLAEAWQHADEYRAEVDVRREAAVQAQQQKRVIERLRERNRERLALQDQHSEAAANDEVANAQGSLRRLGS